MTPRRVPGLVVDAAAAAAVAVAIGLFFGHAFPEYDAMYALLWGDDLLHGRSPELARPYTPAAHPLYVVVAGALTPLGDSAADALRWVVLLATGALVVGVFRLGQALLSWPVGLLAAAVLATREPTLYLGQSAFVDVPTVALVIWAAVLEARRPRRGVPVLVLLVLAGLLRPEVWLVAVAYWAWLAWPAVRPSAGSQRPPAPRRLAGLAALGAAGPALWLIFELVFSGDPLRPFPSLSAAFSDSGVARQSLSEVGSTTGLDQAPGELAGNIGGFLQAPTLALAVAGLIAGAIWLPRRIALPVALGALNVLAFLVLAATGQPLEQRYLFLGATIGALLAAVAALGWSALAPDHPVRPAWRAAGAVALVALIAVSGPRDWDRAGDLRADVRLGADLHHDLRDLLRSREGEAAIDGAPVVFVTTARPVPLVAWWTDRRPESVAWPAPSSPVPGALVLPTTRPATALLSSGVSDAEAAPPPPAAPPGWTPFASGDAWALLGVPALAG